MLQRLLRLAAMLTAALVMVSLAGCVPTVWLPDSSGFIYVKPVKNPGGPPNGQLLLFDVQKKASRVLVEDIGGSTIWPALNPEGKRIAVAHIKGERKQPKTIQLVIYDMTGKQLHKSKDFPWPAQDNIVWGSALLFWSPKDDKIVVSDMTATGIYDVKADTLKAFEKSAVVIHGGTPIRPDSQGFLMLTGDENNPSLIFMDWAGKPQKVDMEPLAKAMKDSRPKDLSFMVLVGPLMAPSWWDGHNAGWGLKRAKITYAITTDRKTINVSPGLAEWATKESGELPLEFDLGGDLLIRLTPIRDEKGGGKRNKVAVINHKTGKEQVLLEKAPEMCLFLPSPDGQYVALCFTTDTVPGEELTFIVNKKGEEVARLTFDK